MTCCKHCAHFTYCTYGAIQTGRTVHVLQIVHTVHTAHIIQHVMYMMHILHIPCTQRTRIVCKPCCALLCDMHSCAGVQSSITSSIYTPKFCQRLRGTITRSMEYWVRICSTIHSTVRPLRLLFFDS